MVGTTSIEINIHDENQIDQNFHSKIIIIQTLEVDTIQTVD